MKEIQVKEFKKIMEYEKNVWPWDLSFFPEDEEAFIEQTRAQQLYDYISIHQKTFKKK